MRIRLLLAVVALAGTWAPVATAQDFGVMESAETIQRGNFKLVGYPMLVFGDDGADDAFGFALRGGYGFTDRFDAELAAAFHDGFAAFGANLELLLLGPRPGGTGTSLSVRGGAHLLTGGDAGADGPGLDLSAILSTHLAERLELVGALDFTQLFRDDPVEDLQTLHLVPGIEARLTRDLDFLAELGVALDDDAAPYLSAGFSYYLR
jgi:hypothetical protein